MENARFGSGSSTYSEEDKAQQMKLDFIFSRVLAHLPSRLLLSRKATYATGLYLVVSRDKGFDLLLLRPSHLPA